MANSSATAVILRTGSYQTNQQHTIDGVLQQAIDSFESAASRFATDFIKDANARQSYTANIKRISEAVKADVASGKMTVKEGAEFCQQMRNKIMEEIRVATSAQSRAYAEYLKKDGKTLEMLLDEYSQRLFKQNFSELNELQKSKIYYSIIESSGSARAKVTAGTRRLRILGKVGLLVTAALAVHSIAVADNKPKEGIRQGAIIAGGAAGGWLAGLAVSTICGPGAPICAVAIVLAGTIAGGYAAEKTAEAFDEELEEFTRWKIR
jgi:hypothetical protein